MGSRINIFFFTSRGHQTEDFRRIAARIGDLEPRIRAHAIPTSAQVSTVMSLPFRAIRPTVSIEMDARPARLRLLRGKRLMQERLGGKIAQYRRLEDAGLPVPRWVEITPGLSLSPEEWGPYVVEKPSRGSRGQGVRLRRTARIAWKPPEDFPDDHPVRRGPLIAQRYIHTGPRAEAYRVLTYFEEPILAMRYTEISDGPPREDLRVAGRSPGINIVAAAKGNRISTDVEEDVLALARQTHAAFPTIPSLGIDIMRDAADGSLWLAEINPSGNSWQFSLPSGQEIAETFGIDFYAQFGALDRIAERSIEIARRYAL
ncbi:MAG: ATP-grasp domain-containing protein [Rubricella sp.]